MSEGAKNLVFCHACRDDAVLHELAAHLETRGFVVRTLPFDGASLSGAVVEPGANELSSRSSIDWAGTLVVLISPGARVRAGIDSEIEYAERGRKRIVGVYVCGGQEADLPAGFQKYGAALVSWPSERVLDALDGGLNTWFEPDGKTPVQERDIERFTCGEPVPE
ncbi:TIR domain-containing protein [Myxococcus sp. AB056]|uniref:TIR domain-containing protein n=1 Tax=Myxococcus sp. AB056 TaxID=2562792 RepID=UPI001146CE85|nr:TIR domain-containing protein [Myxococcus sp. AB056]